MTRSPLFACPHKQRVVVGEWGPLFRRTVIQPGFFCSFLLQCNMPPTFLWIVAVFDSHSDRLVDICIPTHPALHSMLIVCSFGSLPSQSQVPHSLLRLCSKVGFFAVFPAHFFCSALCHPHACDAVSDSHSDQLPRTLPENPAFNTSVRALYAHFLQVLQSAQSTPTSRFLAHTLFRGIIRCTKTSGIAS